MNNKEVDTKRKEFEKNMPPGFKKSDSDFGAYSRKAYIELYALLEKERAEYSRTKKSLSLHLEE